MPKRVAKPKSGNTVTIEIDAERAYYREKLRSLRDSADDHFASTGEYPRGYKSSLDAIDAEIKMTGIDPKSIARIETEAEVMEKAFRSFIDCPPALCEETDEFLTAMEIQLDAADDQCLNVIEKLGKKHNATPFTEAQAEKHRKDMEKEHGRIERGKQWRRRIERLRRVRDRAKREIPAVELELIKKMPGWEKIRYQASIEAAHTLRFMVYVGRSNITKRGEDKGSIFQVARHHCRMAVAVWEAENWVYMSKDGPQYGLVPYEGVMIIMPPAHGKSEYMTHRAILKTDLDTRSQRVVLHRADDIASEMLTYASAAFDPEESVGRRNRALFPKLPLISKKDNSKVSMRLDIDDTLRAATMVSNGVKNKRSGINASELNFDDVTDQDDADQKTERDRVTSRIGGTWMPRLRGKTCDKFWCWVNTIWHDADSTSHYLKLAKKKKLNVKVLVMKCGGPDENFEPLWPQMYSRKFLKAAYAKDPRVYAAAYMASPHTADTALIRKVALYAETPKPDASEEDRRVFHMEHSGFFGSAVHHISVDPAATNRDKSDRAGLIYAAMGDINVQETVDGGTVSKRYPRLRIIKAPRERANQNEIVEFVAAMAYLKPVDYVHIETVSGFHATADMLEADYGIDTVRHQPGNKNKEVRLRRVASAIDNTAKGAIVEFPAEWKQGDKGWYLWPKEEVQWLIDELIRFGSAATDDGVDAVSQLVQHLVSSGDLILGSGTASESVRKAVGEAREPRLLKFFNGIKAEHAKSKNPGQDDWDYQKRMN